jgi:hypothetical protein
MIANHSKPRELTSVSKSRFEGDLCNEQILHETDLFVQLLHSALRLSTAVSLSSAPGETP